MRGLILIDNDNRELIINLKNSIYRYIQRIMIKDINEEKTIVLCSSPRSGSTWVMELLNTLYKYMYIFEPLHYKWFPEAKFYGFSPRTYLSVDEIDEFKYEYLSKVFSGKITSQHPHYKNLIDLLKKNYKKRNIIVKFVRANRFLPWMINNFDIRGYIFLIRHPCSVIESQMRTGVRGYNLLNELLPNKKQIIQEAKNIEFIRKRKRIIKKIEQINYPEEILAFIWALDNYVPLYQLKKNKIRNIDKLYIVKYEEILINTKEVSEKILNFLDVKNIEKKIKLINKRRHLDSMTKSEIGSNYITKYNDRLNPNQISRIKNILDCFNISFDKENYNFNDLNYKKWMT